MFAWDTKSFNHSAWNAINETIQKNEFCTEHSDYFGHVTCGAVCFDLVLRDCDSDGYLLCADPYLLGIDSGYGYTIDGTPYDEYDGFCLDYDVNDSFETALSSFINQIDTFTSNNKTLTEYANKTDVTWKDHD